jgi:hypothetical protein
MLNAVDGSEDNNWILKTNRSTVFVRFCSISFVLKHSLVSLLIKWRKFCDLLLINNFSCDRYPHATY